MDSVSVAVIGADGIGRKHLNSWRRLAALLPGRIRVHSVVTMHPAGPPGYPAWDVSRVFTEWRPAVEDPEVQLVDICLPDRLHAEAAGVAIEAGKHIVCEKPLAPDPMEGASLAERARRAGLRTAVCFVYRHLANAGLAAEMVRRGDLGEVREVHGRYLQSWLLDSHEPGWREDPAGGGVLGDLGSHLVDLASVTGAPGKVDRVSSATSSHVQRASWLLEYAGGVLGSFHTSRTAVGHSNDLELEIYGDEGSLRFGCERPGELLWSKRGGTEEAVVRVNDMERLAWLREWWPAGDRLGWDDLFVHQLHETVAPLLGLERGTATPSADFGTAAEVDALMARIKLTGGTSA